MSGAYHHHTFCVSPSGKRWATLSKPNLSEPGVIKQKEMGLAKLHHFEEVLNKLAQNPAFLAGTLARSVDCGNLAPT